MAVIQCKSCGKRISDKETICPHCGESTGKSTISIPIEKGTKPKKNELLITCKACGELISKNATVCPHCGEPVLGKPVKKKTSLWTWAVLIIFLLYILGEIGGNSKKQSYTSGSSPKHTTTKSTNRRGGGCSVKDFTIKQSPGWMEGEYYKVPFSVTNNCTTSAGVEIQMSFYGKNNTLLNATTGWPASVNNISPGETYNDVWFETVDQDVDRVTLRAVDVNVWK